MPLSFGIPIGLVIAAAGVALYLVTRRNRLALVLVSLGLLIALLALLAVILAASSSMQSGSGLWLIGWLFTMAFAHLGLWQAILGLLIWPYYLGMALR